MVFSGDPRAAVDHFRRRVCLCCDGERCDDVRP
jgi:hypothetical protein